VLRGGIDCAEEAHVRVRQEMRLLHRACPFPRLHTFDVEYEFAIFIFASSGIITEKHFPRSNINRVEMFYFAEENYLASEERENVSQASHLSFHV
jgi:hypothetical protein